MGTKLQMDMQCICMKNTRAVPYHWNHRCNYVFVEERQSISTSSHLNLVELSNLPVLHQIPSCLRNLSSCRGGRFLLIKSDSARKNSLSALFSSRPTLSLSSPDPQRTQFLVLLHTRRDLWTQWSTHLRTTMRRSLALIQPRRTRLTGRSKASGGSAGPPWVSMNITH